MSPLQVDPSALRLLAQRCRYWAADLVGPIPPTESDSISATAAAAAMVHADAHGSAEDLAGRIRDIASLLDDAARHYQAGDAVSAALLGYRAAAR